VPTATPTPTPPPEGLTGTWVGTIEYAPAEYCSSPDRNASAEFVQHGSTVSATLHGACWRNARFEGSASGATLVGRVLFGDYCDSQRQTHGEISPDSEIHISVTGFRGEFCALGGQVVATVYSGTQDRIGRALGMHPDGIATFVEYIDPAKILGSLASQLHDPRRLLVSSANLEDPELMQTVGRRLDGVVGSTWLPSSPPSPVLRDYRRRWLVAFPGLPAAFANHSAVIGYYNALEETVSALGRIRSADVRAELMTELRRAHLDLPGGPVILDRNRQAVRDGYLSRIVDRGGKLSLEPVRVVPHVEQTFAGLLSSAPPPGPDTQPCRKGSPPAWAR